MDTDWLDREYIVDIKILQRDFDAIKGTGHDAITKWIKDHSYLSTNDMMIIFDKCDWTVRKWRHEAGLRKPQNRHIVQFDCPDLPVPPPNWREINWDVTQYENGYSCRDIAKMVKLSRMVIKKRLRRHVRLRTFEETCKRHHCNNRSWLIEHYIVKQLSIDECATKAGVSMYAMTTWLNRAKIRIRSGAENRALRKAKRNAATLGHDTGSATE